MLLALCVVLLAACSLQPYGPAANEVGGVPQQRLDRLQRVVNVTRWFRFPKATTTAYYQSYMNDDQLEYLRDMGVTGVRLAISPAVLYRSNTPTEPDRRMLGYVDAAVSLITANNLAVIIDIHDEEKDRLENDPAYADGFVQFWGALAQHFNQTSPAVVFFEIVNEPVYEQNPAQWFALQERIAQAIRASAPRHTIIATGTNWSSIDGLVKLTPLELENVVYTFHFYEPFLFTHQAASWVDLTSVRQVPYPPTEASCAELFTRLQGDEKLSWAQDYCRQGWNADKIDQRIRQAAEWGRTHAVPLFAGEFGVNCDDTPKADRIQWFRDVRAAFEKYGIGWAVWGYDDCLGLNVQVMPDTTILLDTGVAEALGLKVQR